jgi:hypothetical protein
MNFKLKFLTACMNILGALGLLVKLIAVGIHLWTVCVAYHFAGIVGALISLVAPVISQLYWMNFSWHHSDTIFTPYITTIFIYLISLGIILILGLLIGLKLEKVEEVITNDKT